jgi:hypothetical protein
VWEGNRHKVLIKIGLRADEVKIVSKKSGVICPPISILIIH